MRLWRADRSSSTIHSPTALGPGSRLGPYEVAAQIGVGGMGEVYRATDTNLYRHVVIKVLPEAVADRRPPPSTPPLR